MSCQDAKVLVVDDEPYNLEILTQSLERGAYEVFTATDGREALSVLEDNEDIDIIILDRMMPVMDGMAMLRRLKSEPRWQDIPVIMQTAATERSEVLEGINAGVYYYLTKPYSKKVFLAIVKSALSDKRQMERLYLKSDRLAKRAQRFRLGLRHLEQARFSFKTHEEAKVIATVIASCFPEPRGVVLGFTEIMQNAIEHGNLEISFSEKSKALIGGTWEDLLEERIEMDVFKDRFATVLVERVQDRIIVRVKDKGRGFDWKNYMHIDPARADAPNGRGIYLASLEFDELKYEDDGTSVTCIKKISAI